MRLFAAFLLIITLTSASPTVDPGGWTKAKWEMRKAQLKLAFPLATDYESEDGKVFGLKDYVISKRHFEVTFAFAEDGGLHEGS